MLRTKRSLLLGLALLAAPALARAEEPTKSYPDCGREPTDAEVAAAKGAFQAGNASFNEADYARAIDYWEDAYRRDCTANPLLLNLARAYELAGRKRQAVVSLETFVQREPSSGEKDQINRRIEVLKKKIADDDAALAAAPPLPPAAATSPSAAPAPLPDAEPNATRSAWPWIVIGTGGAVVIIGGISYLANNKKLQDLEKRCDDPGTPLVAEGREDCFDDSAAEDGNSARKAMTSSAALAGIGTVAVVGGVIWWYFDGKRVQTENQGKVARRARPQFTPVVNRGFAGLALSGQF